MLISLGFLVFSVQAAASESHTVVKGDNAMKIAISLGITLQELYDYNPGLEGRWLQVGETLIGALPNPETGRTVTGFWGDDEFTLIELADGTYINASNRDRTYSSDKVASILSGSLGHTNVTLVEAVVETEVVVDSNPKTGRFIFGKWEDTYFTLEELEDGTYVNSANEDRTYTAAKAYQILTGALGHTELLLVDPNAPTRTETGNTITGLWNGNSFTLIELVDGTYVNASNRDRTYSAEKAELILSGVLGHTDTVFTDLNKTIEVDPISFESHAYNSPWLNDEGVKESWEEGYTGQGVKIVQLQTDSAYRNSVLPANSSVSIDTASAIVGGTTSITGVDYSTGNIVYTGTTGIAKDAELTVHTYATDVLRETDADVVNLAGSMAYLPGSKDQWTEKFNDFADDSEALIVQSAGYETNTRSATGDNTRFVEGLMDSNADVILVGAVDMEKTMKANDHKDHYVVDNGGSYVGSKKTSANASARVAGKAAILMQKFHEATAEEIKQLILETATDLGAAGVDDVYGHGQVNLLKAMSVER